MATVIEVLNGEVIPEPSPAPEAAEAEAAVPDVQTPVATPEVPSVPAPAADIPGNGIFTVACGQPRYAGGTVPPSLNTCGQALVLDMQEDRVTGCSSPEGQIPDLIQIAGLKTRAFMCNQCFAAHRNSSKVGAK